MAVQSKPEEEWHLVTVITDKAEHCDKLHKAYPEGTRCRHFPSEVKATEYLMDKGFLRGPELCTGQADVSVLDNDILLVPSSESSSSDGTKKGNASEPLASNGERDGLCPEIIEHNATLYTAVEVLGHFIPAKTADIPKARISELAHELCSLLSNKIRPSFPSITDLDDPALAAIVEEAHQFRRQIMRHRNRFLLDWEDHRILLQKDHPGKYLAEAEPARFSHFRKKQQALYDLKTRCFDAGMQQATSAHPIKAVDALDCINELLCLKTADPADAGRLDVKAPIPEVPASISAPAFMPELLEPFDGNRDEYPTWEAKTEIVINAYEDPAWQNAVLTALPSKLKGDAASWLLVRWKDLQKKSDSGSRLEHPSWEVLRDDMRRHFRRPEEEAEQFADDWYWAYYSPEQDSATTYLAAKLASYHSLQDCPSEERLVAKIRAGMPEELQRFVPTTIKKVDEIVDLLISQEPVWRRASSGNTTTANNTASTPQTIGTSAAQTALNAITGGNTGTTGTASTASAAGTTGTTQSPPYSFGGSGASR